MFVSVFSEGNSQKILLQHCTAEDAANLSMTCQGLRSVFKEKLHTLQELYLNVDAPGRWAATRDLLDRLKLLSIHLGQIRRIVIDDVSSVALPILVEIIRTHFTQLEDLSISPEDRGVYWSPLLHWLPDSINNLEISECLPCFGENQTIAVPFGDWSRNLEMLQIRGQDHIILEDDISLDSIRLPSFWDCTGFVQVKHLQVKWLNQGCLEMVSGVTSLCVSYGRVSFADMIRLCPDLIELQAFHSERPFDHDADKEVYYDLSHSRSLQKLCISASDEMPWKVPEGCEIVRVDPETFTDSELDNRMNADDVDS